jgi:hypothetical protein
MKKYDRREQEQISINPIFYAKFLYELMCPLSIYRWWNFGSQKLNFKCSHILLNFNVPIILFCFLFLFLCWYWNVPIFLKLDFWINGPSTKLKVSLLLNRKQLMNLNSNKFFIFLFRKTLLNNLDFVGVDQDEFSPRLSSRGDDDVFKNISLKWFEREEEENIVLI